MGGPEILDPYLSKEETTKIPLGCGIDTILDGGVETKTITQLYGPPASGKTNLCLQMAVNCVRRGKKVIFIDTEGGHSVERLRQMARDDYLSILENILFYEPKRFEDQNFIIENLEAILDQRFGLIILDCAVSYYRMGTDEEKASSLSRQLSRQLAKLLELARKLNLAVIVTNQVYTLRENGEVKPIGGNILKHWSKVILELRRKDSVREAVLRRHRTLPEDISARFIITDEGVRDA